MTKNRIDFKDAQPRKGLGKGNTHEDVSASFLLAPEVQSAVTLDHLISGTGLDDYFSSGSVVKDYQNKIEEVKNGDLSELEAMLVSQSFLLNTVFNVFTQRATNNFSEYPKAAQTYINIALKAQSQSRNTVEAINEIKNPKSVTITKQANIADQQIVNNGTMNTSARAEINTTESNELLSEVINEKVDTRGTQETKRANQTMEAMATINRRKNNSREG